jgi:gliding motility-associated lipoprotein GldD
MKFILSFFLLTVLIACDTNDTMVPKPPTYLRLDLPDHSYKLAENCGFTYEISKEFTQSTSVAGTMGDCSFEIDLGKLNGKLYVFYYGLKASDTLSKFINFANDKVDDHKLKATSINDEKIIRSKDRVFGTFFELQGDVATNYQFYLTDSSTHFMRAELLLNARPNYDSLKPSLDYLKVDLLKMVNSLKWKNP